ncbi:TonB-dependent receptor [Alteromonas sp. 345S023]|uniref:TonB-dependent receptor n=1 Tax=Alteromonas profundi TaxID=2696062 RepID=A0A7X5LNH8_9ALTE|nr:TonB-dependent receptor [Alteromonas profundi]NDV92645.1 TonB-dependent receptor [Alteromonas profundi]
MAIIARITPWIILCVGGLAQSNVYAQSVEDIEHIVTTTSRVTTSANNRGYQVSTVSQQDLSFLSLQHVQEALNYIAGAGVQRGNGQEYLPALRSPVLTGAGACGGILAAEDGIALRAAGFCNINELFEAHSEMAQRIEVLKGPNSVLYGSNAIHGVINVITPDTTRGGGKLGVDYGSYGYHRVKFRQGKDNGDSGIGVNASITRDTGYRNDEGVDQEKVNVRHRRDFDTVTINSGLTYTHLEQDTAGYITGFESYKVPEIARSNPNPEAFRHAQSLRLWSKADMRFDNGSALSITPYYRSQDMDFRMHFLPGKPLEHNYQKGVGLLSQYRYFIHSHLYLDTGIDLEYTQGGLVQSQDGPTLGSDFLVETVPEGKHYDYDVDASLIAPYVALNWQYQQWDISLGARYERMSYDYTNNMLAGRTREDGSECGLGGCRYSRPESGDNQFNELSPKLSVSYQLSPSTRWFAGVSRGYRAPQATELYRLQRAQQVAELASVIATNVEFGVQQTLTNGDFTLALYSLTKDNVIYRDSNFFNINNGETWHRGVELTLNYQFTTNLDIAFAGSYARHTYEHSQLSGEVDIKGNDVDTAPKAQVNTRMGYTFTPRWRGEVEWQYVSSYFTDIENQHTYDGHGLLHLRLQYDWRADTTVTLRVNNLLDKAYADRADYTEFTEDRYFPGRPRSFMLSAMHRF